MTGGSKLVPDPIPTGLIPSPVNVVDSRSRTWRSRTEYQSLTDSHLDLLQAWGPKKRGTIGGLTMAIDDPVEATSRKTNGKKPFYRTLWGQVLIGVAIGIVLGYLRQSTAIAMKPLGAAFIRVISMIIKLVIFCTIVTGIAGMGDMKKVGRVGGKALLYFEVISTIALLIGLVVGNLV